MQTLVLITKTPAISPGANVTDRVPCASGNAHFFAKTRTERLALKRQFDLALHKGYQLIHIMDKIFPDLPGGICPQRISKPSLGPRVFHL